MRTDGDFLMNLLGIPTRISAPHDGRLVLRAGKFLSVLDISSKPSLLASGLESISRTLSSFIVADSWVTRLPVFNEHDGVHFLAAAGFDLARNRDKPKRKFAVHREGRRRSA
jgi:hypothetical protein